VPHGATTRSRARAQVQAQQQASSSAIDAETTNSQPTTPAQPPLNLPPQVPPSPVAPLVPSPATQPIATPSITVPAPSQVPATVPIAQPNQPNIQLQPPAQAPVNPPRRMPLTDLPGENERLAPKFDEKRPEEAGRYFSALEALFDRHAVTTNGDRKLGSLKYSPKGSGRLPKLLPIKQKRTTSTRPKSLSYTLRQATMRLIPSKTWTEWSAHARVSVYSTLTILASTTENSW